YRAPGSAWHLRVLDGDDEARLVYGAHDGSVGCMRIVGSGDRTGPLLDTLEWKTDVGAFPFALEVDGETIYAATAGGELIALDRSGRIFFRHASAYPLYAVAPGTFRRGTREIACGGIAGDLVLVDTLGRETDRLPMRFFVQRAVAGDFDGDGEDELFVMDGREEAVLLDAADGSFREVWRGPIRLPDEYANWENPANTYKPFSIASGDVDVDGTDELVMGDSFNNRQAVLVMSGDGAVRWVTDSLEWWADESTWYEFFSTAFVALGDYPRDVPGRKVVSAAGGLVRIHSATGGLLGSAESRLGFAALCVHDLTLYLGSTPNGDETVYEIALEPGWEDVVRGLEEQGCAAAVAENLRELRGQAMRAARPKPDAAREVRIPPPYELHQFSLPKDDLTHARYRSFVESFEDQIDYPLFRHTIDVRAMEDKPVLDENGEPWNMQRFYTDLFHGTMTVEEIVETARTIERERVPTLFGVGHNCNPSVQLSTAERMLEAAPTCLVGFQTAEDVSHETIYRYAKYFLGPLCDLCLRHGGRKVVIKNKVLWWLDAPANRGLFDELFSGERRRVIVAATEESNARWSDINLMARMSLLRAGLVGAIKVHIHRDMFCYNRFHQWEFPKSGHPFLRMLVAHTLMGASVFSMAISHVVTDEQRPAGDLRFNDLGRESTELFYHLLGSGAVFPPAPDRFANISPVGIVMHEPSAKWLANAHNNHRPWEASEDEETLVAVLPQLHCGWGNAPLSDHALSRVLFHKRRVFDGEVPATPYGHILMLPEHADRSDITRVEQWWHTDGIRLWREDGASSGPGARLTGAVAARALRVALEAGRHSLPISYEGDDLFYQVIELEGGTYRLTAIDPGWLDPAARSARFTVTLSGEWDARDVLSGEPIAVLGGSFELTVPAGTLRIVDVRRAGGSLRRERDR
ncbi:MAG: PQQ-binding-like beta-propeller repeat protein, partial [bacterium]